VSLRWTSIAVALGAAIGVLVGGALVVLAYGVCTGDSMCTESDRGEYVRLALLCPLLGAVLAVVAAAVIAAVRGAHGDRPPSDHPRSHRSS